MPRGGRPRWCGSAALCFFATCLVCLCLLSLLAYCLCYDETGALRPGLERFGQGLGFVWGEATVLDSLPLGNVAKPAFLIMGAAVLLTTELGVLDAVSRIAADLVKTRWLAANEAWTESRLYFCFLWAEIAFGSLILMVPGLDQPLVLLVTSAAMNGGVMFLYSMLLLWMNCRHLPRAAMPGAFRRLTLVWSTLFFGWFTLQALVHEVWPALAAGR